jgi:glucose-6-phosphate 1-dehydrogenase
VRFRLSPEVAIGLGARVKRSGEEMVGEPIELRLVESPEQGQHGQMDAYERLLGDAMAGDSTLFARQDLVEAAWKIVEPLLQHPGPLHEYEPGTWGPPQAKALIDGGTWRMPNVGQ